jgi:hypothetical protein
MPKMSVAKPGETRNFNTQFIHEPPQLNRFPAHTPGKKSSIPALRPIQKSRKAADKGMFYTPKPFLYILNNPHWHTIAH